MGRIGLRNDASTAVNIAMKIRSFPYVWGGTSLSAGGFDCSGFVSICYFGSLTNIGYGARDHYTTATLMSFRDGRYDCKFSSWSGWGAVETGDIVFYPTIDKVRIGHTAIVLKDYIYNGTRYNGYIQSAGGIGKCILPRANAWEYVIHPREGVGIYISKVTLL